jgi:RNA polymerase sigma factor (sigma-70 family)
VCPNSLKENNKIPDWWNQIKDSLHRYAEKLCGDSDFAKDLVQQVALAVLVQKRIFNDENHFQRWAFQKLRWFSLDYFRKRDREKKLFINTTDFDGIPDEPKQERDLIISELHRYIKALPPRQKEIAVRYYVKHHDIERIASALNIKRSTVRSMLRHARLTLAEHFKDYDNQ